MNQGLASGTRRGQALVMMTMSLFMLFGVMGLAVDLGWGYYRKQAAQSAADAAAMAAAVVAFKSTSGVITCGANNVVCLDIPAACPAITGNPANNLQNGCLYARANGFTNAGNQTVKVSASALGAAPNPNSFSILYTATVLVTESNPQLFSVLGGNGYGQVAVQSTAKVVQPPLQACIYALNKTASSAFSVRGSNSSLNTSPNCGIAINSNSATALVVSGSASVTSAFEKIAGGFQIQGQSIVTPTPMTGASQFSDPLGSLAAPPTPSACDYTNARYQNGPPRAAAVTLNPGTYCGGIYVGGSAHVTLNPGVYYIYGGGITFNGLNSVTIGSGVTFFNTDGRGVSGLPTSNFAPITVSGQPSVTLSAPSGGAYSGVLFFKDRNVFSPNNNDRINGSPQLKLTGTLYLPGEQLTLTGAVSTASNQPSIIADTISVRGGTVVVQTSTNGTGSAQFVALAQ